MSDLTQPPTPPAPPGFLQRLSAALLPQFIAYSRKSLVWFSSLSAAGILELVKSLGTGTEAQQLHWTNELLLIQGVVLLVAKFWTDQIAHEDAALKTGLPAPAPVQNVAGGNITVEAPKATPSPNPAAIPIAPGK